MLVEVAAEAGLSVFIAVIIVLKCFPIKQVAIWHYYLEVACLLTSYVYIYFVLTQLAGLPVGVHNVFSLACQAHKNLIECSRITCCKLKYMGIICYKNICFKNEYSEVPVQSS